jgi:hypothetical protein
MKGIITLLAFTLALTSVNAQLLTEDFNFTGVVLGTNSWITTGTYTGPALSTTSGLTYAGFSGSGVGNAVAITANGEDLSKALPATVSSGKLYMTFMVNVSAAGSTADYFTGFTSGGPPATGYNLRIYVKNVAGGIDFGVSRGSITTVPATAANFTGNVYNLNQTYLITCKYEWISPGTADDACSIYIHPTTPASTEPVAMSATQSGSSGLADGNITSIFMRQGTAANAVAAVVDGFRVATTWSPTIPVEFVDFKAKKENTTAKLIWQTATELNNSHYGIERSLEGKTYEKIGEILGYGNSNQSRTYSFVDEKPNTGVNYYRLRQVDLDGKETVTKAVSVNFSKNTSMKVYPNIVKDNLVVDINAVDNTSELTIVNLLGQVVQSKKLENTEGSISINISGLPNGFYLVRLNSKGNSMTERFEKQ